MDGYNIDDLIGNTFEVKLPECKIPETFDTPLFINNKPTMNLIEQKRFNDFMASNKLTEVDTVLQKAETIKEKMCLGVKAIDNILDQLNDVVLFLEDAIDDKDIKTIEVRANELTTMLNVIEEKPLVDILSSILTAFGIEMNEQESVSKEEIVKAFGLVKSKK